MLREALQKLSETRTAAGMEVFPSQATRAGWEMRKRQAQAELPAIKAEFDRAFKKAGFPVFLYGDGVAEFLELAPQETESLVLTELFSELRAAVRAAVGRNREFGVSAFTALIRELRQVGASMGLSSIPALQFRDVEYVADDTAVDAVVDRYVIRDLGPEFIAAAIEREACMKAEGLSGDYPVVPVYITGVAPEVAAAVTPRLFGGKSISVQVPAAVDAEFVISVLQNIKSVLKQ